MVENNQKWQQVRKRLAEFPPHFYPDDTIKLLDTCRASRKLRQLIPGISLGRLTLERYDAYERGKADYFVCLYFYETRYIVSDYDNEKRCFFETSKQAIEFVEQHLSEENPFSTMT